MHQLDATNNNKRMKKLFIATLTASALMLATSPVFAQIEQSQEMETNSNSNVKVDCDLGAYGQGTCYVEANSSASASGSQSQKVLGAKVVYRADGTPIYVHEMVDTSLDNSALLGLAGVLTSAGAVVISKIKNRA